MPQPPDALAAPASAPTAASAKTAGRAPRVPGWDNARFVSVTLVVIGHAIQRLTSQSDAALIVYLVVYAFHMPAFAIISGYFSKDGPPGAQQMKRVVTDIVVPYVVMESIWTLVQFLVEGKDDFNPSKPSWTLWFLLALAIFRLVFPYLALVRWPLLWAVILSIVVGYLPNIDNTLSLSRAIGILPFFVLGWKLKQWGVADRWTGARRTLPVRLTAVGIFAVWIGVVVAFIDIWRDMNLRFWFFYDDSYSELGGNPVWAGGIRLLLIALAALLSLAFLVLIPRRETWFTPFGQATMYVYLLHSFVLYPIRETGVLRVADGSELWLLTMVFAGIAISIALASPVVRRVFRPLIEPRSEWLFLTGLRSDRPTPATAPPPARVSEERTRAGTRED